MNFKAVHYAQAVCAAVSAAALAFAQNDPAHAGVCHVVAAVAGSALTMLGMLSGSVKENS